MNFITHKVISAKRYDLESKQPAIACIRQWHSPAFIAIEISKHLSMVAGLPDGEDSAGRSKVRLMTPAEVAERACAMAEQMWGQFESRGWLFDVPTEFTEENDA